MSPFIDDRRIFVGDRNLARDLDGSGLRASAGFGKLPEAHRPLNLSKGHRMKHRALVRIAAAALAATVVGMMAASPAAAEEKPEAPEIGQIELPVPEEGITVKGFATKGCEGIPGGAK